MTSSGFLAIVRFDVRSNRLRPRPARACRGSPVGNGAFRYMSSPTRQLVTNGKSGMRSKVPYFSDLGAAFTLSSVLAVARPPSPQALHFPHLAEKMLNLRLPTRISKKNDAKRRKTLPDRYINDTFLVTCFSCAPSSDGIVCSFLFSSFGGSI